jgi:ribonuclease T
LQVTGIDPFHPLRPAIDEGEALRSLFQEIRKEIKEQNCNRAILVGHNSFFDLQFLNAAVERAGVKRNPFHPFSSFDTATLGGIAFGQTVLSRAVTAAGFEWHDDRAHSALYDADMTAKVFCTVVNRFRTIYDER